ncbi:hypothetical protein EV1_019324 [Malus domestica]
MAAARKPERTFWTWTIEAVLARPQVASTLLVDVPIEGLMHQEFALAKATSLTLGASSSAGVASTTYYSNKAYIGAAIFTLRNSRVGKGNSITEQCGKRLRDCAKWLSQQVLDPEAKYQILKKEFKVCQKSSKVKTSSLEKSLRETEQKAASLTNDLQSVMRDDESEADVREAWTSFEEKGTPKYK